MNRRQFLANRRKRANIRRFVSPLGNLPSIANQPTPFNPTLLTLHCSRIEHSPGGTNIHIFHSTPRCPSTMSALLTVLAENRAPSCPPTGTKVRFLRMEHTNVQILGSEMTLSVPSGSFLGQGCFSSLHLEERALSVLRPHQICAESSFRKYLDRINNVLHCCCTGTIVK